VQACDGGFHEARHLAHSGRVGGGEKIVLRGIVVIHRGRLDAGSARDVADRGAGEAAPCEFAHRDAQQVLARPARRRAAKPARAPLGDARQRRALGCVEAARFELLQGRRPFCGGFQMVALPDPAHARGGDPEPLAPHGFGHARLAPVRMLAGMAQHGALDVLAVACGGGDSRHGATVAEN
jgi:hypothetical protein